MNHDENSLSPRSPEWVASQLAASAPKRRPQPAEEMGRKAGGRRKCKRDSISPEALISAIKSSGSVVEAASKCNMSTTTFKSALEDHGIKHPWFSGVEHVGPIIHQYLEGRTVPDLARVYGKSPNSIQQLLRLRGIYRQTKPLVSNPDYDTIAEERFWNEGVDRTNPDDCWEWRKARNTKGYGNTKWKGAGITAHRLAYQLTHGSIPAGLLICHKCDNPPCCNPRHLFAGSEQDNSDDCVRKGRAKGPNGEAARHAKLTNQQVREIRSRWARGEVAGILASEFKVRPSNIYRIIYRKTWTHI